MASILIVDDEESMRITLSMLLKSEGYTVSIASGGEDALRKIQTGNSYDLVITDLKMDKINGITVLETTKEFNSSAEVLVLTAYGSIDSAVEAMRLGAFDYISKPFESDELLLTVEKALERKNLLKELKFLRKEIKGRYGIKNIIGKSKEMRTVMDMIHRVAETDVTVLIEGESGVGKELVARAIHSESLRCNMPFIPINCGAVPETLLESELFGHVKGSFTGASFNRKGLFEEADKGTLFLDEIAAAPPLTQIKLLRVLEERNIKQIGDNNPHEIDVRLIAATNKKLKTVVKEGHFREDLFYRLNVIALTIPPLRERKDDILLLCEHFLDLYSKKNGKDVTTISNEAMDLLVSYYWPGNVRELENTLEGATVLTNDKKITPNDLPAHMRQKMESSFANGTANGKTLDEIEKKYIVHTLQNNSWNQAEASKKLGIGRNTLWRKMKRYNISRN